MSKLNHHFYVGIDVSKRSLDVFVHPMNRSFTVSNSKEGFKQLLKHIPSHDVSIAMEATGGYEASVANFLKKHFDSVSIVNPRRVRDLAKAFGQLAKTDSIDAKFIALFAEKTQPQDSS